MATERPTASGANYAYVSIGQFQKTLESFTKIRPDRIDQNFVTKYGVPAGSAFSVVSALRFLGVIDDNLKVINPQLLVRLGNLQQRPAALRELVDVAYADLLRQQEIEKATVTDIDLYFQYQGVSPNVSIKAARFFLWIAQESGYTVGEQVQPLVRTQSVVRIPTRRENNQQVRSEPEPNSDPEPDQFVQPKQVQQTAFNKYEEELLQILLANMKESKTLPDTELLREIQKLIASVKGQPPPTSS